MTRVFVYGAFVALFAFVLMACATDTAKGPAGAAAIPVTCVPDKLGDPLPYPDTEAALKGAVNHEGRVKLLMIGRKMKDYRLSEVEPVISGCRQKAPTPSPLPSTPSAKPRPDLLDRIKSRFPG